MPQTCQQLDLTFVLPSQDWLDVKETAKAIGMKRTFVEEVFDPGTLAGFEHNAGEGLRMTKRIHRTDLASYMARAANHDDAHKLQLGRIALQGYGRDSLIQLRQHIDFLLTR